MYTMLGSIFLYLLLIIIYNIYNNTSDIFTYLYNINILSYNNIGNIYVYNYINILLIIVFIVKLPLYPFYK